MDQSSKIANHQFSVEIAEDDPDMRQALKIAVERAGYKVIVATDGQQAYELAEKVQPNIILLDLLLPKMSGKEVLTRLRQSEWGKVIPVIVLTNLDSVNDINEVLAAGPSSYYNIKANTSIDKIVEEIAKLLGSGIII